MNQVYFALIFLAIGVFAEECNRPSELKAKEEFCWSQEVEVVDRIVQRSKNVLNFAKKKLGIEFEEEKSGQKCEYYMCIMRQLHFLNSNDYPAYENIQNWAKLNVIYFQAVDFFQQLDKCNSALTNSTIKQTNFCAKQLDEDFQEEAAKNDQTTCDISSEFVDCLSRQKECPVFQFP